MDEMASVSERDERPPLPQAAPSRRIGKYEIIRLLGKGAMGAVYHAHDPLLERDVALKVMLPQIADDPEHKQRFEREARAVARMMHPNVVTVFDLGYHTDGSPYIVMELLKGRDLLQTLRDGDRKSTRLNSSNITRSFSVFHLDLHSFPTRRSSDLPSSTSAITPTGRPTS